MIFLKDGSKNISKQVGMSGDLFSSLDDSFDPYEKYKNTQDMNLSELLALEKKSFWDIICLDILSMQLRQK